MWRWAQGHVGLFCQPYRQRHITREATKEIKLDGYRTIGVKFDRGVNLFSRRRKSFNRQYPYLAEALSDLPERTVVDGEVVALDESGRELVRSRNARLTEEQKDCWN